MHTNTFDCYAFHIQINVTVVLFTVYPPNVSILCLAVLGNHQSLLGNHIAILGCPVGNHHPIKFGKPWCGGGVRSILLLPLLARCLETIDVCIWHMFVFMSVVVTVWGSVGMFVV